MNYKSHLMSSESPFSSENEIRINQSRSPNSLRSRGRFLVAIAVVAALLVAYGFLTPEKTAVLNVNQPVSHQAVLELSRWIKAKIRSRKNGQAPVTIVTALFDIGDFRKGDGLRTQEDYLEWIKAWQKMRNGVVFYTNKRDYETEFKKLRQLYNYPTKTIFVDLDRPDTAGFSLWSLHFLPNITSIFQRPGYPKHYPNTVRPMYSVIVSGKYDMVENTILTNPFNTDHFAWFDIGLYREYPPNGPCFVIELPKGFDQSKISMTEVSPFRPNLSTETLVRSNEVWICAGVAFGERNTFLTFIDQFRSTARSMLEIGWYSTEQQTLYAMFSDESLNVSLLVDIQTYESKKWGNTEYSSDKWFYLGYFTRKNTTCQ